MEHELGNCEVEHVSCGSGLERIYRFLQSDESYNRPTIDLDTLQVKHTALMLAYCSGSSLFSIYGCLRAFKSAAKLSNATPCKCHSRQAECLG